VLDWHTLWRTSRARSIHDAAKILRTRWNRLDWVLLAKLPELLKAHNGEMIVFLLELVDIGLIDIVLAIPNNVFDLFSFLQRVDECRQEVGI
jgi:hypothetical protein